MKAKITKAFMLIVLLISVKGSMSQVKTQTGGVSSGISTPEQLRVENGLISHFEAGSFGGLSSSDQWLGLGPAYISSTFDPSIYGLRIQRNGQGLLMNIVGSNLDSRIAWGGQNGNPILQKGFLFGTNGASFKETFRHTKNNVGTNYWGDSYASNGLLGHYVAGTYGDIAGGSSQWIGIGQPYNPSTGTAIASIYGVRTQWDNQALNLSLRDNTVEKDALLEWGNGGGLMKFRYITNPSSPSGFRNIQLFNPDGQVYVGGNDFTTIAPLSTPSLYVEAFANVPNTFSGSAIYGYASFGKTLQIGVFGDATGNLFGKTRIGVYGAADPGTGDFAGYSDGDSFLNGDAFYTGSLIFVSDRRLKRNIVQESTALNKLMLLKTYTYNMQTPEKSGLNLAKKLQHGFIAQEVEEVFPELVNEVSNLNRAKEKQTFKGVNYISLIPVLTKAIQEQQVQIEELKKQLQSTKANEITVINETTDAVTEKVKASSFMLAQNVPNPFTSSTTIKYSIPANNIAMIAVFDLNGKMLLQFPNLKGASQITINGSTLQAGMYLYSLLVNGQEIITKKMVLTK